MVLPQAWPHCLQDSECPAFSIHQENCLKPKDTRMSSAGWSLAAAMSLVAHSPVAGFLGGKARKWGLKENKPFPPHMESEGTVASGICFQL